MQSTSVDPESAPQRIFGGDGQTCTRRNIFETEPAIQELATSVAALLPARCLAQAAAGGGWVFRSGAVPPTFAESQRRSGCTLPAWLERFGQERLLAIGTGFLVRHDLLLTAGHCICLQREDESVNGTVDWDWIRNAFVVFDLKTDAAGLCPERFGAEQVYKIASVVAYRNVYVGGGSSESADWALLQLSRSVVGREPLTLNFVDPVRPGQQIFMIGHPWGLPSKYSTVAEYINPVVDTSEPRHFGHRVDSYGGNSGSPIFDAQTHQVVGIHIRGVRVRGVTEDQIGVIRCWLFSSGHQVGMRVESLQFAQAVLPYIAAIAPSEAHQWRAGLSIEGVCSHCPAQPRRVVLCWSVDAPPRTYTLHGLASSRPDCPGGCGHPLRFVDIDHLVLYRCRYSFRGMNQDRTSSREHIGDEANDRMPFRIRVAGWRYIELMVAPLGGQLPAPPSREVPDQPAPDKGICTIL